MTTKSLCKLLNQWLDNILPEGFILLQVHPNEKVNKVFSDMTFIKKLTT